MATKRGTSKADKLAGTSSADALFGLGGNDTIKGLGGNDKIDGGTGNDTMSGAAGNDIYYIDSKGDKIVEAGNGGKHDLARTSITLNLKNIGSGNVEDATLLGTKSFSLTGTTKANILTGNSGDNVLVGGGGKDILNGKAGDDLLIVADDLALKTIGGTGTDTLRFTGSDLSINFNSGVTSIGRLVNAPSAEIPLAANIQGGGIEVISIIGSGDNKLHLGKAAVTQSDTDQLQILSNEGDLITLGFQFEPAGTVEIDGKFFDKFTSGDLVILVPVESTTVLDGPLLGAAILDGVIGFRLDPATGGSGFAGEIAGRSVSLAGDVNGDGFMDLLVGSFLADASTDPSDEDVGLASLIFGGGSLTQLDAADGIAGDGQSDMSELDGVTGYRFFGESKGDQAGYAVSSAGDLNGDGFSDLFISAFELDTSNSDSGGGYVVFGGIGNLAALDALDGISDGVINLSELDGSTGFRLDGPGENEAIGYNVSGGFDINGDGFDDVAISAPYTGVVGSAFVVLGKASGFSATLSTGTTDPDTVLRFNGFAAFDTGHAVAGAGDVDGDGIDDFLIGALRAGYDGPTLAGSTYLIFGGASNLAALDGKDVGGIDGSLDLSELDGSLGYRFDGTNASDFSGFDVAGAGDFNGDGFADIIISADYADPNGVSAAGSVYIVFGGGHLVTLDGKDVGGVDGTIDLSELDGNTGFRIDGTLQNDILGNDVSSAGDINGDGFDDILIGAHHTGDAFTGAAYVIFGGSGGFDPTINVSTLDGENGFRIDGLVGDELGKSVSAAGDIDGDGFDDIIVGAYLGDAGLPNGGAAYVIYGSDFRLEASFIGTSGDDKHDGTIADEILIGAQGDDTISSGGGADSIQGGSGNDEITVTDRNFFRIDGGGGTDTFTIDVAGKIDFGNIDNNFDDSDRGRISGIEIMDVTNAENNTLFLAVADLLDFDCQNTIAGNGVTLTNVLRIDGNAGDTLTVEDDDWDAGDSLVLTGYTVYTTLIGNIQVAVDNDIVVSQT